MTILSKITVPKENADTDLLVRKRYFKNNDMVEIGDELIDLETSKTAIIIDSPIKGFIEYKTDVGETVSVGSVIIIIHDKPIHKETVNIVNPDIIPGDKLVSKKALEYILENNIELSDHSSNFITLASVMGSSNANNENKKI